MEADEIFSAVNELRVLVFIEMEDYESFYQVAFTSEQYKKLTDLICSFQPKGDSSDLKPGYEMGTIRLTDKYIPSKTFENLNSTI